jgi:hypothetical protein
MNRFELYDTFGDGWDTAKFRITDTKDHDSTHYPTTTINPQKVNYCFNPHTRKDGDTVTTGIFDISSKFSWEVLIM